MKMKDEEEEGDLVVVVGDLVVDQSYMHNASYKVCKYKFEPVVGCVVLPFQIGGKVQLS